MVLLPYIMAYGWYFVALFLTVFFLAVLFGD
jgi:hypothetical protein